GQARGAARVRLPRLETRDRRHQGPRRDPAAGRAADAPRRHGGRGPEVAPEGGRIRSRGRGERRARRIDRRRGDGPQPEGGGRSPRVSIGKRGTRAPGTTSLPFRAGDPGRGGPPASGHPSILGAVVGRRSADPQRTGSSESYSSGGRLGWRTATTSPSGSW